MRAAARALAPGRIGPHRAPPREPEDWATFAARAAARLDAYTDKSVGDQGCWRWFGSVNDDGYGRLQVGYRFFLAHRLALGLKLGRLLRRAEVSRHQCLGNRLCVNPGHLLPGTIAQNNHDLAVQDRVAFGERSAAHKLTTAQVVEICERAAGMGYGRFEKLGREYGVTGRQIAYIVSGEKRRRETEAVVP